MPKLTLSRLAAAFAVMAMAVPSMQAKQLTPAEALQALSASGDVMARRMAPARGAEPKLAFTQKAMCADGAEINAMYVFNRPQRGFVIVAADDAVATPMLAYSDTETFGDAASMPANIRYWLDGYAAQIAQLAAEPRLAAPVYVLPQPAISPMLTTKWDQGAPYNNDCPLIGNQRCVTGCVATAMAQVINYHKYPAKGTGKASYSFTYNGQSYTQSFNFGNTTFDWDNMLDDYATQTSNDAQKAAVATLMHACGVAAEMNYTPVESGAMTLDAVAGALNHMGYNKAMRVLQRRDYSQAEWDQLIYTELSGNRPVMYGGAGEGGGHQFVCDGYDGHGYWHFNWGWSGTSDGYYMLSDLYPPNMGIGGGTGGGFSQDQDIVVGFEPDNGTSSIQPNLILYRGNFNVGAESYNRTSSTVIRFVDGIYMNYTPAALTFAMGLKLVDATTGASQYLQMTGNSTLKPMYYMNQLGCYATTMPIGNWIISPAYLVEGQWYDMRVGYNANASLGMTVTQSTVTFTGVDENPNLAFSVVSVTLGSEIYTQSKAEIITDIKAEGREFYGTVRPVLFQPGSNAYYGVSQALTIGANETQTINWIGDFTTNEGAYPSAGDYYLTFVDDNGTQICGAYGPLTVAASPTGTPTLTVTSMTAPGATGQGSYSRPYIVSAENAIFDIAVSCSGGYFADNVEAVAYVCGEAQNGYISLSYAAPIGSEFLALTAGSSKTLRFETDLTSLEADKTYYVIFNNSQTNSVFFKIVKTGVADLTVDGLQLRAADGTITAENGTVEAVYTLDGRRAANGNLTGGIYVAKVISADGVASAQRVVVR